MTDTRKRWSEESNGHVVKPVSRSYPPGVFVESHQVPPACRELFQLTSYRYPNYGVADCLRSLLQMHNETCNCWTHIPAAVYFAYRAIIIFTQLLKGDLELSDGYILLLWTSSVCMLFSGSSIAHTFNSISVKWRKRLFLLDYSAISFCASGTALAYSAYLPDSVMLWGNKNGYMLVCVILCFVGILGCSVAMVNFAGSIVAPPIKVLSFGLIAIGGNIPMVTYSMQYLSLSGDENAINDKIVIVFTIYAFSKILGGVLNATSIPERCQPGMFDCFGHSHQLFHILVFLAFVLQYEMVFMLKNHLGIKPNKSDAVRGLLLSLVAWPIYGITTFCFARSCKDH